VDGVADPTAVCAAAEADLIEVACGTQTVQCFEIDNPPGSDNGGDIQHVMTSYNESSGELVFSMKVTDEADGFTVAINDGPNPKGHAGEMSLFYFDGTAADPTVTAYAYNGKNTQTSWMDGAPETGTQAPDQIATSMDPGSPFNYVEMTVDENGDKIMSFSVDANVLGDHVPANPGPGGADEWSGAQFGEDVGIWLHPVRGLETSYDDNGYLDQWSIEGQGWYDTANQPTEEKIETVYEPDHYEVSVDVEGTFGDYTDGSEAHYMLVEVPEGWTVTGAENYEFIDGAGAEALPDATFLRMEIDNDLIADGGGSVSVPVTFEAPLSDGEGAIDMHVYAQSLEQVLDGESNLDNNAYTAGGVMTFEMADLFEDGGVSGAWGKDADGNVIEGAAWGGGAWFDDEVGGGAGDDQSWNDDDFLLGGGNDLFLFNADDGTFGGDGEMPKWTDLVEAGFGDGASVAVDEDGWTTDIEGDGETDDDDLPTRDDDRISTEENIAGLDDPDRIEW